MNRLDSDLTPTDELASLERQVRVGIGEAQRGSVRVALALVAISTNTQYDATSGRMPHLPPQSRRSLDDQLGHLPPQWWAASRGTFGDYAQSEFGIRRAHAYRLVDYGRVLMSHVGASFTAQSRLEATRRVIKRVRSITESTRRLDLADLDDVLDDLDQGPLTRPASVGTSLTPVER